MIVLRISDAGLRLERKSVPRIAADGLRPRVLYVARAIAHFIYHETVIVALLRRGGQVKVLFDEDWSSKKTIQFQDDALNAFRMRYPQVEFGWSVRRSDRWRKSIFAAREIRSYANYLRRGARTTEFYVNRWLGYVPNWVRKRRKNQWFRQLLTSAMTDTGLRLFERVVPADRGVVAHLREENPHVVVVSPSNMRFSEEVEYVKAAKYLGVPVALHTMTWDNLSTKGLHHLIPDVVFLWNEIHYDDIREFHGFPEEVCSIAGSPFLERWFDHTEPEPRSELCARMGVDADRPYLIYLGSSKNIAKDEAWVVERLHALLRASNDLRLRRINIIIRPHPANVDVFQRLNLDGVVIWPLGGALPQTADLHNEFRSMLAHAVATVGINTTAMSDSLLADCPCLSPLLREYDRTQRLANHFKVLADREVMVVCEIWSDVERGLVDLLDGIDVTRHRRLGFKAWFARPRGIDRSAGDVIAERIIGMMKASTAGVKRGETVDSAGLRIAGRIAEARNSEAFRNYLDARDVACAMLDETGLLDEAISTWMDASPLMVANLRGCMGRECGDDPGHYRGDYQGHEVMVRHLHQALNRLDNQNLWSREPDALGQYGYESDAGRLNLTGAASRYALLALNEVGFLGDFLKGKKRTLAVVGGNWGGLPLAFVSRFPNSTVFELGSPERLVRVATYLRSVAPNLKVATLTRSSFKAVLPSLLDMNVVLVPDYLGDEIGSLPIDTALFDATVEHSDIAAALDLFDGIAAAGCGRLCAVSGRSSVTRQVTGRFGSDNAKLRFLIDWPAFCLEAGDANGDVEALGSVGRLHHVVVRR
ncbi:MAG: hypothetical protein HQ481_10010 [Alphaproteobacteria bacterium]|nr:hypothetical protein [Alphaproteobacteria bacterium]